MHFRLGCALDFVVPEPSIFIFNVAVARCAAHNLKREQLRLAPILPARELVMPTTGTRFTRLEVPEGRLSLRYEALVESVPRPPQTITGTQDEVDQIPPEAVPYLFSSRYCQADLLTDLACEVAGNVPPGEPQVSAICDWVFNNLRYLPGASDSGTSALDTQRDGAGVCRDFAHLGIALCRAMGIPARFVTGYAWGLVMPDFHACMEAFFAGHWHLFDPSRKVATNRMIRIGTGRDAADASFATIFGDGRPSKLTEMTVFAEPA
jgi:transglutaminase-like putative cysteine protease